MVRVPSVTTIEGIPSLQTSSPLMAPSASPMSSAAAISSPRGISGCAALSMATAMPVNVRLAAIDRSMDLVRITTICPSERMTKIAVSLNTDTRFAGLAKAGKRTEIIATIRTIAASSHSSR